jgi:signal peptidase II
MQKLSNLFGFWHHNSVSFTTALVVVAADQLSKLLIRSNIAIGQSVPETGFFRLTHNHNTGVAFGLFPDLPGLWTAFAIVGVCLLLFLIIFLHGRVHFLSTTLSKLSLGLILGGTVGNLIDRLRVGQVTDFIDIGIWPNFNIADASVVVGALLLAFLLIKER